MQPHDRHPPVLVLLVDDDARTARLVAQMLREDGYDVDVAADGAAAISRLANGRVPDVLVTDFRMPHADGVAVARFARSRSPSIPVLVVTGYPHMLTTDVGHPMPVVLTKPVAYVDLRDQIGLATPRAVVGIP